MTLISGRRQQATQFCPGQQQRVTGNPKSTSNASMAWRKIHLRAGASHAYHSTTPPLSVHPLLPQLPHRGSAPWQILFRHPPANVRYAETSTPKGASFRGASGDTYAFTATKGIRNTGVLRAQQASRQICLARCHRHKAHLEHRWHQTLKPFKPRFPL